MSGRAGLGAILPYLSSHNKPNKGQKSYYSRPCWRNKPLRCEASFAGLGARTQWGLGLAPAEFATESQPVGRRCRRDLPEASEAKVTKTADGVRQFGQERSDVPQRGEAP